MNYSDLLHPPGDKVSLGEMALIRSKLPARATKAIPSCMYTDNKRFDYEVLILLFWVMVRRENETITEEEVGELVGLKEEGHLDQIEKEILYFYTRQTREEIDDHFKKVNEAIKKAEEAVEKAQALARESEEGAADEISDGQREAEVEEIVNPPEDPEKQEKI